MTYKWMLTFVGGVLIGLYLAELRKGIQSRRRLEEASRQVGSGAGSQGRKGKRVRIGTPKNPADLDMLEVTNE
jgi:hypothetical protein